MILRKRGKIISRNQKQGTLFSSLIYHICLEVRKPCEIPAMVINLNIIVKGFDRIVQDCTLKKSIGKETLTILENVISVFRE